MSGRILRAAEATLQPWKNGLGLTRELALYPPGSNADDFLWRCSVAEVVGDAPFSRFDGIDRQIVLLEGAGFEMTLDHEQTYALRQPLQPFAFAGEAQVSVALIDGPTRDFNLMLRRGRVRGAVRVCQNPGVHALGQHDVLVYCARGQLQLADEVLQAGDAWLADHAPSGELTLEAGAAALVVQIQYSP
jgi:environmental stress-induced protein Ves